MKTPANSLNPESTSVNADRGNSESHTLVWWAVKNGCGMALIACMLLAAAAAANAQPFINLPLWLAQLSIFAGAGISLYHYLLLKRKQANIQDPQILVQDRGLFAYTRHPMYFGDCFLFTGFWLMANSLWSLSVLLLGFIAIVKQAQIEDRYIARRFPSAYLDWSSKTGLLLPRF